MYDILILQPGFLIVQHCSPALTLFDLVFTSTGADNLLFTFCRVDEWLVRKLYITIGGIQDDGRWVEGGS